MALAMRGMAVTTFDLTTFYEHAMRFLNAKLSENI